jgi:hypothetical protein
MKPTPAKDLLAALQAHAVSSVVPPGFYTMQQLCSSSGMHREAIRKRLHEMKVEVKNFRVNGRVVPHYRAS